METSYSTKAPQLVLLLRLAILHRINPSREGLERRLSKDLGFDSASTSGNSQLPATPVPGDLTPSSGLQGHLHTHGRREDVHIHINKTKSLKKSSIQYEE